MIFDRIQKSLGLKTIFWLSIVLIVIFIGITTMNIINQRKILVERALEESRVLGRAILAAMRYPMLRGDQDIIQLQFDRYRELKGVQIINLLDHNGIVRRSTDRDLLDSPDPSTQYISYGMRGEEFYGVEESRETGKAVFTEIIPIKNEEKCFVCHGSKHDVLGVLKVSLDWQPILSTIARAKNRNIGLSILGLVGLSLLTIAFIFTTIIKPIEILNDGMEEVSTGNLDTKIATKRGDEIGKLTKVFNKMTYDIKVLMDKEKALKAIEQQKTERLEKEVVRREIVEHELQESENKIRSIMNTIPHAVLGLREREITFANAAVEDVFGWQPAEVIGKKTRIFYRSDEDYERIGAMVYPELERQSAFTAEFPCVRKNGEEIICQISATIVGEVMTEKRIVVVYEDISERKAAEEALQKHMTDLERYHKFVVGRELKMRELKEKIQELKDRLGAME